MKTIKIITLIYFTFLISLLSCKEKQTIDYQEIIKQRKLESQYDSAKWEFYFLHGSFGGKYLDDKNNLVSYENLYKCEIELDSIIFKGDTAKYYFNVTV